jgi:predicted nuclease of predicted toxin-antitoxin system
LRFLVDSCAGRLLAERLLGLGHDAVRVKDRGSDPGHEAILRWAVEEGRILITMDKDFGTLIVRERLRHAGVIRIPQCMVPERKALVAEVLELHGANLAGALVTVRGGRIRVGYARGEA